MTARFPAGGQMQGHSCIEPNPNPTVTSTNSPASGYAEIRHQRLVCALQERDVIARLKPFKSRSLRATGLFVFLQFRAPETIDSSFGKPNPAQSGDMPLEALAAIDAAPAGRCSPCLPFLLRANRPDGFQHQETFRPNVALRCCIGNCGSEVAYWHSLARAVGHCRSGVSTRWLLVFALLLLEPFPARRTGLPATAFDHRRHG